MNKYTAAGLVAEARRGRDIAVITTDVHSAMEELQRTPGMIGATVRRANGLEEIRAHGDSGRIVVRRPGVGMRGVTGADVVFLDADLVPRGADTMDLYHDALAMIHGSPNGEIIRA
ncbi:hypothetical protein [Microbacterium sp.]|uniref:hypothetical protein n=1 Tax=Microbacterium sp. TaxID=51671 RepID=UPI003A92981E